ncbi:hypothetical protein FD01_GL002792 [Lacticaseibacillus manihotivorans DSM 13343 = JCM 12514]|jgi:undecaprenol kinase|uniref:Diacylglycerol kinase n=2 Tax=Lacticaseibacillus manihotivorans TaxID=88233 RepID=A0A0R1Q671_9LACO|nr:hypothetical protein FD01_GL002792 [Lacticaseibacillus manihotivorans DSM 13343 = JCM 12514]
MASNGSPAQKNRHFLQSLRHAVQGFGSAFKTERNLRFDVFASIVVVIIGLVVQVTRRDWLWLVLAMTSVIAAELANTVVEALVRLHVGPNFDPDPQIGRLLNMAAGFVLVIGIGAALIGVLVFWPYLIGGK